MILGIIIFAVILIVDLIMDYIKFLNRKAVDHTGGGIVRGILLLIPVIFFASSLDQKWYFTFPISFAMVGFTFWLLFDGIYNLLRKENWWYVGSDDKEPGWESKDSKSEDFLRRMPLWKHATIKLGGTFLAITAYVIMYLK